MKAMGGTNGSTMKKSSSSRKNRKHQANQVSCPDHKNRQYSRPDLTTEPEPECFMEEGSQVGLEGTCDDGLDVPDDALMRFWTRWVTSMMTLMISRTSYWISTRFQFGSVQFLPTSRLIWPLPSIVKVNPRQPSSFDDYFEEEAEPCGPLIAETKLSEPEGDVDVEAKCWVFTTEVEAPETLRGIDDRETIRRVMVCGNLPA